MIQKVYQLRATGDDGRVVFSERLWHSHKEATECKGDFAITANRKGLSKVIAVTVLTLELR